MIEQKSMCVYIIYVHLNIYIYINIFDNSWVLLMLPMFFLLCEELDWQQWNSGHLPSTFHKLPWNSSWTFGSQTRKSLEEGRNEGCIVLITIVCNAVPFTTVLCCKLWPVDHEALPALHHPRKNYVAPKWCWISGLLFTQLFLIGRHGTGSLTVGEAPEVHHADVYWIGDLFIFSLLEFWSHGNFDVWNMFLPRIHNFHMLARKKHVFQMSL